MKMKWRRPIAQIVVFLLCIPILVVSAGPASAADGFRSLDGSGSDWSAWEIDWEWDAGQDQSCAPDLAGDGWNCQAYQPNVIRYTGQATRGANVWLDMEQTWIEVYWDDSSPVLSNHSWRDTASVDCFAPSSRCGYPSSTPFYPPAVSDWKVLEDTYGGYYSIYIGYSYEDTSCGACSTEIYETSLYKGADPLDLWFDPIVTNINNAIPEVTLLTPEGATLHRQGAPEFHQNFMIRADDDDGHNWTGEIQAWDPDNVSIVDDALSGLSYRDGTIASTQPYQLPHKNGTYTWRARARDTSGLSTANSQSNWVNGSFQYIFNLAPEVPDRLTPMPGQEVPEGLPVSFVIQADDPELDAYRGNIEVRGINNPYSDAVTTAVASSGQPTVGQLDEILEPGEYEWRARTQDVLITDDGTLSNWNPSWQQFTVTRSASNAAPGAPALIAPSYGAAFGSSEQPTFVIRAYDGDAENPDSYVGVVRVRNSDSGEETSFATSPAGSGATSSGSPPIPLESGHTYQWWASATDVRGATGPEAGPWSFSIASPAANLAPSTTLVSPSNGAVFGPRDPQLFTARPSDPEGEPSSIEVEVDGQVVCETAPVPSGQDASCAAVPKLAAGVHSWRARATDSSGSTGGWTGTRSFTVLANSAPGTPALIRPANGHTFPTNEPQLFSVQAIDADSDPYHATITVKQGLSVVATFDTAEAPSGVESFGSPTLPLPPGTYTWSAVAVDVEGNVSGASSSRTLVINSPPGQPSLVSPSNGYQFAGGQSQVFTISATDPDGQPYRGDITIKDAVTGAPVLLFSTPQVSSGSQASASPPVPLPPGAYTWSATAQDNNGGQSGPSGSRSFSVSSSQSPILSAGQIAFVGKASLPTFPCSPPPPFGTGPCQGSFEGDWSGHVEGLNDTQPFNATWATTSSIQSGQPTVSADFEYAEWQCLTGTETVLGTASGSGSAVAGPGQIEGRWQVPGETFARDITGVAINFNFTWTRVEAGAVLVLNPFSLSFEVAGLGSQTIVTGEQIGAATFVLTSTGNTAVPTCSTPLTDVEGAITGSIPLVESP